MRTTPPALRFTTIAQVVLVRKPVAAFYGNELWFGLVLATWPGGMPVGHAGALG